MDMMNELDKIIKCESITTVFQPIVSLANGDIIGYEALSRGPKNSPLHNPEKLFSAAHEYNRLWELEYLCRSKAIERAKFIDKDKHLFINVDPFIFKDEKYRKGFTKPFLAEYNMSPETIIFEITERTCIEDYKNFKSMLENYVEDGYKIAIDDTGSGYSGLKMLSYIKPHYIKMDMDLIRNIHEDSFKQNLIASIVSLANKENMKLIAEGIEKEEELIELIKLGVYAGQGYFLQSPDASFLGINEIKVHIIKSTYKKFNSSFSIYYRSCIGQIAREDNTFNIDISCKQVKNYFDNTNNTGACIVDNNTPVGLIMSHTIDSVLATQYSYAVFSNKSILLVMDNSPFIVDYNTSISDVASAAMNRKAQNIYDYIIVTRNSKYYGIVTVKRLLNFITSIERKCVKRLDPITFIPQNITI
ncbi:EAL domain-containing protein [Clostridium caseinilyticum]|uniref:EAL domain-containing protein n=1 Tax=Clostridium caseinilyticum TaxID=3350403 RepID=UPI0038F675B2